MTYVGNIREAERVLAWPEQHDKWDQPIHSSGLRRHVRKHSLETRMITNIDDWDVTYALPAEPKQKLSGPLLSLRRMVLISASFAVILFVLSSIFSTYLLLPAVGISVVLLAVLSMANIDQWRN